MIKAGFVGFGEVNTPKEIIINKCESAAKSLKDQGLALVEVFSHSAMALSKASIPPPYQ
jgi:hypothetical protein